MKKSRHTTKPVLHLAVLALLTGLGTHAQAFLGRVEFSDAGDFSEAAIVRGVQATPAQCAAATNSVWADAKEAGAECLKYWKSGFTGTPVKKALVFFHGDIFVGTGKTGKSYLESSNEILQRNADAWSKQLGLPYIFVGRPGTHGSSGDHMQRRRIAESKIISAALDALKARYGVQEWVVTGQSGGGHVTSSLLTMRTDIVCAVPTSAPSSPRIRWELMGRTRDTTNYDDSYEPHRFMAKDKTHPELRVFVLGNPQDRNVFWASQTVMADALRQAGVAVQVLQGEGSGPDAHGLSNSARMVGGWCARDMGTTDMLERASKGLKG